MKTMLVALSFLLSTSSLTLFPEAVTASGNVLRDLKGDELVTGVPYYIVSSLYPIGGGVSLDKVTNNSCPVDVTLLRSPFDHGIPVIFSTSNEKEIVITDYTSVSISFETDSSCAESTLWIVEEDEPSKWFVKIGGAKGYSNAAFKLINEGGVFGSSYKLVAFYHAYGKGAISNVGIEYSLFGARRLALTDQPLLVSFEKVKDNIKGLSDE